MEFVIQNIREEIKMTKEKTIVVPHIDTKSVTLSIIGTSDLVLNKMNKRNEESLIGARKDESKKIKSVNEWEDIITAMHWRDPFPKDMVYDEDALKYLLKTNAPCISAFGLKKSFGQAVVRNGIDSYATKFDACCNITAPGNLIPISFTQHFVDEKLMSPKRGAPVLVRLNRFTGWTAEVPIQFIDGGSYGLEQICQIVKLAGFGIGIGSGRSSGFGRYDILGGESA